MTDNASERTKAKRRKRRVELIKTIVIAALFVSMVTLASAYIVQTQLVSINPAVDVNIESLLILHGSQTPYNISSHILPEFVGYKISGNMRGLFGNESLMRELYGLLDEYLSTLLGSGGECETLPEDKWRETWNECFDRDYIYVRYFTELPASAVYYGASGERGGAIASGDMPYIREMFILLERSSDETVKYSFVTRSGGGAVSVYKPSGDAGETDFDISAFTAYNDSRIAEYSFLGGSADSAQVSDDLSDTGEQQAVPDAVTGDGTSKNGVVPDSEEEDAASALGGLTALYEFPDTTVLTDGEFPQKYISVQSGASLAARVYDGETENELLRLLGFNTDQVGTYESENYKVYLGASGKLKLSDSGTLEYTAVSSGDGQSPSGGVSVSSFLGYESYGGNYSYSELLTAAASLLGSIKEISPELLGGDAQPGLTSVYGGESGLKLEFGYFYDNYRMVGLETAISIEFSGGSLVRLEVIPADIAAGGLCVSIPQSWAAARLYTDVAGYAQSGAEPVSAEFVPVYNLAALEITQPGDAESDTAVSGDAVSGDASSDAAESDDGEPSSDGADTGETAAKIAPVWALLTGEAEITDNINSREAAD